MEKIIFLLLTSFIFVSCNAQKTNVIDPSSFEKGITQKNIQLVDVRTPGEFNNGHIKNAVLINWNEQDAFKAGIALLDKSKAIYIYCQAGGRSSSANTWLQKQGFKKVYELKGGMTSWLKAKKQIVF
jgi:phage shock protein E